MWRTTISNLRSHVRRLISTGFSVVLGVGFLAATLFIGDSLRSSFDDQFREANEDLAVAVRSETSYGSDDLAVAAGTVPLELATSIAALHGVDVVVPSLEGRAQLVGSDGEPVGGGGPPTIGGNWIDDPTLNPYALAEGRAPTATGEVVIDRGAAEDGGLDLGDSTMVLTPEPVPVEVVGIATFGDEDSFGPVTYVAFSEAEAAQHFVGGVEVASRLLVASDGSVSDEELAAEIDALLPRGLETLTGSEVAADELAQVEGDFLGFFEAMLLAFAGIALVVATFSIHNTFSILVAQRARESALLRAVGASRAQVVSAVAFEALVVGVTASVLGVVVGVGLANLALAAMSASGFGVAGGLAIQAGAVVTAVAIGVVTTFVASLVPSLTASRIPPLAAIRDVATERTSASRVRVVLGGVIMAVSAAVVISAAGAGDDALVRAALGGAGLLVATVVLGPVLARPVVSIVGAPIAALRGQTGVLARRNALRNPRRTSGTASALVIGVAVVAMFTVFASSITTMIDDTVERSFGGDLVVAITDEGGSGLSPELAGRVEELAEVERAVGLGESVVRIDGETVYPTVTEPSRLDGLLDLEVSAGSLADVDADGIAVSSGLARDAGWAVGDVIEVELVDSTVPLTIAALYDSTELIGETVVAREMWEPHATQATDVAVLIEAAPGVSLAAADDAVSRVTESMAAPEPQTRDEYVDTVAGQVEQVLGIIYGLLAVAVLIAVMGIANTISLSVHERTRELGLLRAVGQSRAQLRAMVRWESVIVSVFGTLVGLALGMGLSWALLQAMEEVEGVSAPLTVPGLQLAWIVAVGAAAGVLAAWRPSRRASRLDVLAAIATD